MRNQLPRLLNRHAQWAAAEGLRLLRGSAADAAQRGLLWEIRRNVPNAVSLAGVLPLCILLTPAGYALLPILIVYNNLMDDLDGMLARWMGMTSHFGFRLDNVCDAVAHSLIAMAVGAHFGGWTLCASMAPAGAIILRMTSRLRSEGPDGLGSTTNELMRHLLFLLLGAQAFGIPVRGPLMAIFLIHAFTMIAPISMPHLLRSRARSVWAVGAINVSLAAIVIEPRWTPIVALPFVATFVSSFVAGFATRRPHVPV
jgi:phosphatidylserine synthase